MNTQRQVAFWLAALLAVVLLLYLFNAILLPFVVGMVLAYLLDPLADRLERLRISRLWASLIILGLFLLVFILALMILVPVIANQIAEFAANLPSIVSRLQHIAIEQGGPLIERFGGKVAMPDLEKSLGDFVSQGATWLLGFMGTIWTGGAAIIGVFSILIVTPVVAFYLLVDWDSMVKTIDGWTPLRHRETVRRLAREIDRSIAGFVRGQGIVCLSLGAWYAVGLSLIGLNFGALIGFGSGLLSFIPYVGSLTGFVLSVGVAIVQFWDNWPWILAVCAVYGTGQFLEGNILQPKLVGEAIGVHPVWLMFALFAFGALFGFIGVLLAVPLAAVIGVLSRFAIRKYLASPFYDESNEQQALPPPPRRRSVTKSPPH